MKLEACLKQIFKQFHFSDFWSNAGTDVVSDFGSLEIRLVLLLRSAELLLLTNC